MPRIKIMKVIFVCTGNTCRSPMAAAYLNSMRLPGVFAESRGLAAAGDGASKNSILAMKQLGIDISDHVSRQFTVADTNADLIVCMGSSHLSVLAAAGVPREKLTVLGGGISDPYGGSADVYIRCRDEITEAVDSMTDSGVFTGFTAGEFTESDIPAAAELEKECFGEPWSENAFKESLAAGTHFFAVRRGESFAGYIGISTVVDEGYIANIAVCPKYRRMGAASQLIGKVLRLAKAKKLAFVSLEVRASNIAAQALYGKFGFITDGRRRGFYRNPAEDALIMTKRFENRNENSQH